MIVPKPPVKLEGHCSVIHDNILYTYSSNGFASIPLERDGTWSELTTDGAELVSDAVCITGGVEGNEHQQALYVVGGSSSKPDAPGLQRYSFEDETWKAIPFKVDQLSNRTGHGAAYLRAVSTILVYGGNAEDGSQASSDTFYLSTKEPYTLDSQSGENASPGVSPTLLSWNDATAALFGGQTTPKGVHFWDSTQGWHNSGYNLNTDFPTGVKSALIPRSDGRKLLQSFDITASPVTVKSTIFSPDQAQSSKKRKREEEYPDYDGALAPTTTEEGWSLAQGDRANQLVVISGGSGTDSLSIFNQTSNSWVNSTKLFYGDKSEQEILGSTPTTSSQPTASPSDSSTPAGSSGDDSSDNNIGTILGAVLGSLAGVAIILVLILFYIKRKKEKQRKAGGADNNRLSFQDQGVEPLTRSAYPMAQSPAMKAASSVDSLAIFAGNTGDEKSPKSAGSLPQYMQKSQPARPSPLNNIHSSDSRDDKAIEAGESPVHPGDRTTDEGWGKYFQDNHTTPTLVGMQSPYDSTRGSKATIWPGNNNALPPLDTSFLHQPTPLGRVNSGSPTTEFATSVRDGRQIAIPESQSARISSADSASINSEDDVDRYHGVRTQSWLGRPPSSNYSRSFYNPHASTRELPSTAAPSVDYRKHDSARTNTRGSSILIPEGQPVPRNNVNSDMSWLNLNADR
ncbi:hypothetical protein BDW62DRAFT_148437 [Aspergillus aurantiobrunneus]